VESPRDPKDAPLARHYKQWFLEYASYVILDRAVPHIDDGLKPVQRRILHTLWEMDDGRFHKVANVTGQTMALHPHGNASIDAALVGIAQRGYLIEQRGIEAPAVVEACLTHRSSGVTVLDPSVKAPGRILRRWGLRINIGLAERGSSS